MLSGGLDSFIGAINLLKDGKSPIFVSHYGGGKGVKIYQDKDFIPCPLKDIPDRELQDFLNYMYND